jgi:hypothetical protein
MAALKPTQASCFRAIKLCLLLLFRQDSFSKEQEADNNKLKEQEQQGTPTPPDRAELVRKAFFNSFWQVQCATAMGAVAGKALSASIYCATPQLISWLQVLGAALLLWGTLFVRGWEIQTFGGITLTERVNQWLYRFLYLGGTAAIVFSLTFEQCH